MVESPLTSSAAKTAHSTPSGWFAALSTMIGVRMMPVRTSRDNLETETERERLRRRFVHGVTQARIVSLIDARAAKPQKPGPKPGTKYGPRRGRKDQ